MASYPSPISPVLLLILHLCSNNSQADDAVEEGFEVVSIETLFPSTGYTISEEEHRRILQRDSRRVAYLQNRIRRARKAYENKSRDDAEAGQITVPAKDGILSTPQRNQTVIFDTRGLIKKSNL